MPDVMHRYLGATQEMYLVPGEQDMPLVVGEVEEAALNKSFYQA